MLPKLKILLMAHFTSGAPNASTNIGLA
jgi:hypothetical protein